MTSLGCADDSNRGIGLIRSSVGEQRNATARAGQLEAPVVAEKEVGHAVGLRLFAAVDSLAV
jgi:hypothetical protein